MACAKYVIFDINFEGFVHSRIRIQIIRIILLMVWIAQLFLVWSSLDFTS